MFNKDGSFSYGEGREQPDLFDDGGGDADFFLLDPDEFFELSARAYSAVVNAEMHTSLAKQDLEDYVRKVFSAARKAKIRAGVCSCGSRVHDPDMELAVRAAVEAAAFDRGDPLVRRVLDASFQVGHEIHRILGFLRFNPFGGLWLARCSPDHNILPALAGHFVLRFGEDSWAVVDEKRGLALVRLGGEPRLGQLSEFPFLSNPEPAEDAWEELWRCYHRAVIIENRKNLNLQAQFMPRRYWKYLPEKRG